MFGLSSVARSFQTTACVFRWLYLLLTVPPTATPDKPKLVWAKLFTFNTVRRSSSYMK
jgi:hypothetical protein